MDKFKDIGMELQTANKEAATGMMRNFCVLTMEASFDAMKGTWSSEYTNHRVLVGPKDKCDTCKAAIEDKLGSKDAPMEGWTFTLNEQIHS